MVIGLKQDRQNLDSAGMLWEWIQSLFGWGNKNRILSHQASKFAVGDLVWYLCSETSGQNGPLESLDESVAVKQFRITDVIPMMHQGRLTHFVYRIEAHGQKLKVHESFLSPTLVEALDGIQIEYLS